jgi:flagellar FliJ protein
MAFRFALETVLRVRSVIEEREERLLKNILYEVSQARESLVRTEHEIAEVNQLRQAEVFKPFTGLDLQASYGHLSDLKQRKNESEAQLTKLEQLRARQMTVYERARQNREMLTNMREDKLTAFETSESRREQQVLDDTFAARKSRR